MSNLPNLEAKRRRDAIKDKDRPEGWSVYSNTQYYTPRFANELIPHLDKLLEDEDKEIVFSSKALRVKTSSLYTRIYQGWKYLCDKMDPTGKYTSLRSKIAIKKQGLIVRLSRSKAASYVDLKEGAEEEAVEFTGWRDELVKYVEESADPSSSFERKALSLEEADIDWLVSYLGGLDDLIALIKITDTGFKVVKNSMLAKRIKEERAKIQ